MILLNNIHDLAKNLENAKMGGKNIIATSGFFAPIHIGHIRCFQEAKALKENSILIVIVNGDNALKRKTGRIFMKLEERFEIVESIRDVSFGVSWEEDTVSGALEILRPHIFAKGGDRSEIEKVPEAEICKKIGCKIVLGVGGKEKVQSSSNLIKL